MGLVCFIFQTFYKCHLKVEKCFFIYTDFCLSIPSKIKIDTLCKQLNSVELDRFLFGVEIITYCYIVTNLTGRRDKNPAALATYFSSFNSEISQILT